MRELGLEAVQPRAWKKTTVPGEVAEDVSDRVERDFTAEAPGRVAVGDITYLKTGEGWSIWRPSSAGRQPTTCAPA